MTRMTKVLAVVLALVALVAGCADDGEDVVADAGGPSSTSSTSTTDADEVTDEEREMVEEDEGSGDGSTRRATTTTSSPPAPRDSDGGSDDPTGQPVTENRELGVRVTLEASSLDVGPAADARFVLRIETISDRYVLYDENVDRFAMSSGGREVWTGSCGFARPAVIEPASLAPGKTLELVAAYPSSDPGAADCRPPGGQYELAGTFSGCSSPGPGDVAECEALVKVRVSSAFRQR